MQLTEIKEYYPNGQLLFQYYEDENGLWQGDGKRYYNNGQLSIHSHFKDDMLHGKRTRYNEDGSVLSIRWFSNGEDITDHYEKILKWKSLCS